MTESNQPLSSELLAAVEQRNREHRAHRAGWLRAAVLGANDGLVSTASLLIGIVAAGQDNLVITAGIAGITAGAMSMAVGEYMSVSSQTDDERDAAVLRLDGGIWGCVVKTSITNRTGIACGAPIIHPGRKHHRQSRRHGDCPTIPIMSNPSTTPM